METQIMDPLNNFGNMLPQYAQFIKDKVRRYLNLHLTEDSN